MATLTISAPAARIVRTRSGRSLGIPSKSCDDSTMRFPPVEPISSDANAALNSRSMYSAPRWSAQSSSFLRSDSASLNAPPSHSGRHVTMQGPIRPANAPVTSGSLTESRRSSTRSAPAWDAASRRRRNSAVVGAATVMTNSGLDIKKASSTCRLKRLGWLRVTSVSGQGSCPFSLGVIPPSKTKREIPLRFVRDHDRLGLAFGRGHEAVTIAGSL